MAKNIPPKDPATGKFVAKETVETPDDNKVEEEVNYADIVKKDIHTLATEKAIEEKPVVETPKEEPKEEVTVEEKKEEEVEFDPEAFKKEVTEKVSKETADKVAKALTGKDATETQKDKYQVYAEKFAEEKGRQPTWFEIAAFIKDEAKAEMKADEEAQVKQREEQTKQVKESEKARTESFNKYVDEQLNELYAANKLPKVVNKDDKNDPGVVARMALFQSMLEVNQGRVKEGKPPIYSIKEIFYEHYKAPNAQVPGADAPISAGRGSVTTQENNEDYSYQDVHKKSFIDHLMGR